MQQQNGATVVDVISLTLSSLAFITSIAALCWTIFEWHRSGARLTVRATSMVLLGNPLQPADRWMVAISTTNTGRTATTVTSVGFEHPKHVGVFLLAEPAAGPNPVPKRLEPGESFDFPAEPDDLIRSCAAQGLTVVELRPYANSGHGRFVGKGFDKAAEGILRRRMSTDGSAQQPTTG